jgi:predicted phosphodiesterase
MTAPEFSEVLQAQDAQKALTKALRQLDEAKRKNAELVEAVYQAARDAAAAVNYRSVPKPASSRRTKDAETAVILLSDWQLAKVTPSYSSEVCAERIAALATKVQQLTEIQRADHPVNEVRVYLLGDLVEGEMIFPGQAHRIDASLFRQVMLDGPQILGDFLRSMATTFQNTQVTGVIGNHGALGGRARKEYHPESNADSMMYETTRLMLEAEKRVTWAPNFTEGERHWYAKDTVGDNTFFLFHGDQVKGGFAGFPWYGFGKKLLGWNRLYGFDYAVSGHFHTPVRGYYNGITHWGNGSTESDNTYANESLSASGSPSQWLLFVHPEAGVTSEHEVHL